MTLGSFEHDLFLDQLRQIGKRYESTLGISEFTISSVMTPSLGDLSTGDLAKFMDIATGEEVIGIVSNIKVSTVSQFDFINVWITILSGDQDFLFQCRLNREQYNDAILYTNTLAMHIDKIEIIESLYSSK